MRWRRSLLGLVILTATAGVPAIAGQGGTLTMPGGSQDRPFDPNHRQEPPDPGRVRMQEEQAKKVNDERQKKLVSDTAKLYAMAGELKEEVAKSDKNTLSVDVVKKAEEIERLARSVKEKMRG